MVSLTLFRQRIPVPPARTLVLLYVLALVMMGTAIRSARGADDERDRSARVALALAGSPSSDERDRSARVAMSLLDVATPPKAKGCSCDNCQCAAGKCPACPAAKRSDLDRIRDALVRVRCGDASGSGTVIWSESGRSVILTADHVVAGGGELTVRAEAKWNKADVLGRDESSDLAVLLVSVALPAVAVADADPRTGADALMVGCTSLWSKGKILGRDQQGGREVLYLSYDSDSGDSGAGVFVAGELVGVHCGKAYSSPTDKGTPHATAGKPIRAFLAKVFRRDGLRVAPVAVVPVLKASPATTVCPTGNCSGGNCQIPMYRRR